MKEIIGSPQYTTDQDDLIFVGANLTTQQPGQIPSRAVFTNNAANVKTFGAKGDGVTDDTVAFQAALDYCKATGKEIYIPAGTYKITSQLNYITSTETWGPRLRGDGLESTHILYNFANGRSLIKVRGTTASRFMFGGYIRDLHFKTPGGYDYMSQQTAIDIGNWIFFDISRNKFESIRGHAIWAPTQFVSVNNNTGSGTDLPNSKPFVWVDRGSATGRIAHLQARVSPATGAITGIKIVRAGSSHQVGAQIHIAGCGSGFTGHVSAVDSQGGITATAIDTPGSGYYEENDHLFDNEDTFTAGLGILDSNYIIQCDGVGMMFPHFASGGNIFTRNYIIVNGFGGMVIGGNSNQIIGNSIATNGFTPLIGGSSAGWYPGIWLRRTGSTAQNNIIAHNELDSNTYAHVLLDGTTGTIVRQNRCNSWITIFLEQTNWDKQIPQIQFAIENGNSSVGNSQVLFDRNSHRWQPNTSSLPTSTCSCTSGSTLVTGIVGSPLASQKFKVGARVEILNGSTPITFGGGVATETTIAGIDPVTSNITLTDAANTTLSSGTIRAKVNQEYVTWVSAGYNANSDDIVVNEPFNSTGTAAQGFKFREVANWHKSQDFAYTSLTWRRAGNPGLAGANGNVASAFSIATGATPSIIPWAVVRDREGHLNQSGLPVGSYKLTSGGTYEATGHLTLTSPGAGTTLTLQLCLYKQAIDIAGNVTTPRTVLAEAPWKLTGAASETVNINFNGYIDEYATVIDQNLPSINPSGTAAGLVHWNPATKAQKRWSASAWEDIAGTFADPFDPLPYLTIEASHDSGSALVVNAAGLRSRVAFKLIGG